MKTYFSFASLRYAVGAMMVGVCGLAPALNYDVVYTDQPPVIDGSGADTAWGAASAPMTDFRVFDNTGVSSQQQTSVRLLWDDTNLYVLYEADDNEIVSLASGNDLGFFSGQDQLEMYLDPAWNQTNGRRNWVYHIAVDAGTNAFAYTASGNDQLGWDLSGDSQIAVGHNGTNWTVEMAIAWTDLNSTLSGSPGIIDHAPHHNGVWGAQFARTHSMSNSDNNTPSSKWDPQTPGSFRDRPFGTLTFKRGESAPAKPDLSDRQVNQAFTFENPPYVAGSTIIGLEGWISDNTETFRASTANPFAGNQALEIVPSSGGKTLKRDTHFDNQDTTQYMQYALWIPREEGVSGSTYHHVLYIYGLYGISHVQQLIGEVWFRNSTGHGANFVTVVHYDNPADVTEKTNSHSPGLLSYDTWMYITVGVDPETKTYQVWINDHKLRNRVTGEDTFPARNQSVLRQLKFVQIYSKNFGTQPVYVDDLVYYQDVTNSTVEDWQLF